MIVWLNQYRFEIQSKPSLHKASYSFKQDVISDDSRATTQDLSQESSYSEAEIEILRQMMSQMQGKSKHTDKAFGSWKFTDTIQVDVVDCKFQERKRQLIEHFRTRTTAKRPTSVWFVTIFADLYDFVNAWNS